MKATETILRLKQITGVLNEWQGGYPFKRKVPIHIERQIEQVLEKIKQTNKEEDGIQENETS